MAKKQYQWQRTIGSQTFLMLSPGDLPHSFIQQAFATDAMFWAKPLPDDTLKAMLDNSCTLGLYKVDGDSTTRIPIGLARLVTDYVTLSYLTDVYLLDEYRNLGLGKWIIHCCREITLDFPALRFMVLITGTEQAQALYRRELGMEVLDRESKYTAMGAQKDKLAGSAEAGIATAEAEAAASASGNGPRGADA